MPGRFITRPRKLARTRHWYQRRHYQAGMALVVIGAAVLSDRYGSYDPVQQQHQLRSFAATIRSDLAFCADGVGLVGQRWAALGPAASPGSRAAVAALAGRAEQTCTPVSTDGGVYDLAGLQAPQALPSANRLDLAVYDLTEWAYPNAARYLLGIEHAASRPGDAAALGEIRSAAGAMRHDGAAAEAIFATAAHDLNTRTPPLGLSDART